METNWSEQLQKAGSLGIVILGNILYALAVKLFLMRRDFLREERQGSGWR